MFAPKWALRPHNLARFPSWDPCITPGYWAWYLNVLPTSRSLFRSLFYAFMPRVAFRLFSRRVSPSCQPFQRVSLISCFHGVCAFRLFSRRLSPLGCFCGVCRLPVSRFWRVSLSLVSWCLSYFALHFVFIACVAFKLFSWRVSPSACFYGVCRLQVVFTACVTLQLAICSVCRL